MRNEPTDWKQKEKAYQERIVFLERQLEKSKKLNHEYHVFVNSLKWLGGPNT